MLGRLKRLWELSGTMSDAEYERFAKDIQRDGDFYRKSKSLEHARKGQRLATILANHDPFEGIPTDEEKENDTTNK